MRLLVPITAAEKAQLRAMSYQAREYLAGYLEGMLGPAWRDIPVATSHAAAALQYINYLNRDCH